LAAGLAEKRQWSITSLFVVMFLVDIRGVEYETTLTAFLASELRQGGALRGLDLSRNLFFSFRNFAVPLFLPAFLLRSVLGLCFTNRADTFRLWYETTTCVAVIIERTIAVLAIAVLFERIRGWVHGAAGTALEPSGIRECHG
jgi:hypothetical protein